MAEENAKISETRDALLDQISKTTDLGAKLSLFHKVREIDESVGHAWSSTAPIHFNYEWEEMFKELGKDAQTADEVFRLGDEIKSSFEDAPLQIFFQDKGFDFEHSKKYIDAMRLFDKCSELGVSGAWQWAASARNRMVEEENENRRKKIEQERMARRKKIEEEGRYDVVKSGKDYELFVKGILNRAGYSVEMTPDSGDQGADLIVTNKGGEKIAVQCKFYSKPVGNAAVMEAAAGRDYYDCSFAIVVTNSSFTKQAEELAQKTDVALERHEDILMRVRKSFGDDRVEPNEVKIDPNLLRWFD